MHSAGLPFFRSFSADELDKLFGTSGKSAGWTFHNRKISSLSGGEARAVALSTFVRAFRHEVTLFDEPFTALDASAIAANAALIRQLKTKAILIADPVCI